MLCVGSLPAHVLALPSCLRRGQRPFLPSPAPGAPSVPQNALWGVLTFILWMTTFAFNGALCLMMVRPRLRRHPPAPGLCCKFVKVGQNHEHRAADGIDRPFLVCPVPSSLLPCSLLGLSPFTRQSHTAVTA